jgi:uncharacterized protein (TIGR00725 family)
LLRTPAALAGCVAGDAEPPWYADGDAAKGEAAVTPLATSDARVTRLPIVGVMGSGSHAHAMRAGPLGRWLASESVHLLTGGGRGVMESVSRAFASVPGRRGISIGILPAPGRDGGEAPDGYPNPFVELAIPTHLPIRGERGGELLSRNHINVLASNVLIALPGGAGTASEVALASRYGRPLVAFVESRDDIPELPAHTPIAHTLEAVKAFVHEAFGGLPA